MSRSNQTESKNIAQKFYEWNADKGIFRFFDKSKTDDANPKGTNIDVKLPFKFVVLDVLSTIVGWNDPDSSGIYSNEIKDLKTQKLLVKTFKGTELANGFYDGIKDRCAAKGGKFAASVYIGYHEGKDLTIGHIKIKGAALGAWIDYGKKNSFYKGAIAVNSFVDGKKGATVFKIPVFTTVPISAETDEAAKQLDVQLQEYLNGYFARNNQNNIEKETVKVAEEYSQEVPDNYRIEPPPELMQDFPNESDMPPAPDDDGAHF